MMRNILTLAVLAGSLVALADTVQYAYDDAGRLAGVNYSNGQSIIYTYDKAGNLLSREVKGVDASAAAKPAVPARERRKTPGRKPQRAER